MPDDLFYRVQVSAGGAEYDLSADLTSLSIEEDETRPDLLVVNLSDPYKVFGHALQEGMDVEVELVQLMVGYRRQGQVRVLAVALRLSLRLPDLVLQPGQPIARAGGI